MLFHLKLFRAKRLAHIIDIADKYIFNGELEKIIEVTYSYRETEDGFLINETLFEEFLGQPYTGGDIGALGRKYSYNIGIKIVLIDDIIKKSQKLKMPSRSGKLRRDIFIESLEYVKNVLNISLEGIQFEMQKAGHLVKMNKTTVKNKIKKIEKLEKEVFGEKVIDDSEDFSLCYSFVASNHEKKKSKLSKKDVTSMNRYLKKIRSIADIEMIKEGKKHKKILKGDFLNKKIPRKDYRMIFDMVCEFYNLPQKTKLTSAGSIYDGEKYLEIPRGKSHAYLSLGKLLELLTHEIESHYINSHNGKLLLGNFRGAKNLPKEEGLAKFMEKIFQGYHYDTMDHITESYFTIMAGETLPGKDFEDFMRIMGKEYECKTSYENAVIRAKRNYSFSEVGVQHKDVVYSRGLKNITKYLKNGGEFKKLFLGKVGFHDIKHMSDIYDSYKDKSKITFPIFISDLIYYRITSQQENPDFIFEPQEYYMYLKKKYWFIDFDSFKIIEQIETKSKQIEKMIKTITCITHDGENCFI